MAKEEEEEGVNGGKVEEAGMGLKHHIREEGGGECLDRPLGEVFPEDMCRAALKRDLQLQDHFLSPHHQ